jgi:probable HAF family extracellular repeat protein
MRYSRVAAALLGILSLPTVSPAVLAQTYGLIELGTSHTPTAMNSSAQVVGIDGPKWMHPWLWSNGTTTGIPPGGAAQPSSINDSGLIVGTFSPSGLPGSVPTAGFSYAPGATSATVLPSPVVGASGINNAGQVTGSASAGANSYAFVYANGSISNLGTLGGPSSHGNGINSAGAVTGTSDTTVVGSQHAFVTVGGSLKDLGTLGGLNSYGLVINTGGIVAGFSDVGPLDPTTGSPIQHAFLYSSGQLTDLGTLGGSNSWAHGLNDTGQVTGSAQVASGDAHAFLYSSGAMHDLNQMIDPATPLPPGLALNSAQGINAEGWIIADAAGANPTGSMTRGYLLGLIYLAPYSLSFGNQAIDTKSAIETIALKNNTQAPIAVGNFSISGDFTQSNTCGTALSPGANCTVSVIFAPVALDTRTGILSVTAGSHTLWTNLTGVGTVAVSLTSSSATTTTGVPVTLTWSASTGASCTPSGGTSGDGWAGTLPSKGSASVTESTGGTYTYVLTCTEGTQTASSQTVVTVAWPPITTSLSASPTTITAGQSTVMSWTSNNATSCSATGGGANDGWGGAKATAGSQSVTEPNELAVPSLTLTFTITCTSSVSGLSAQAAATVLENKQSSGSSGGGSIDFLSLLALSTVVGLKRARYLRYRYSNRAIRPVPAAS